MKKHIGKDIEKVVRERKISIKDFADLICTTRSNVYYIFKQSSINYDRLKLISNVLNHDFCNETQDISTNKKFLVLIEVHENQLEKVREKFNVKFVMSEI